MNPHVDYPALLQQIADVSPRAQDQLAHECHATSTDRDAVTVETQLHDALTSLVEDLDELGVALAIPAGELCQNYARLARSVTLLAWLLPARLYPKLRAEPRLSQALRNILDGVGDAGDSTAATWLKYVVWDAELAPELAEALEHLLPYLGSSPVFDAYLQHLLTIDPAIVNAPELAGGDASAYAGYLQQLEQRFAAGLTALRDAIPQWTGHVALARRVDLYLTTLGVPEDVGRYTWLFAEAMPAALPYHAKRLYEFAASQRLHVEYYLTQRQAPDEVGLVGLALRAAVAGETAFTASCAHIQQQLATAFTLSTTQLNLWAMIRHALTPITRHAESPS